MDNAGGDCSELVWIDHVDRYRPIVRLFSPLGSPVRISPPELHFHVLSTICSRTNREAHVTCSLISNVDTEGVLTLKFKSGNISEMVQALYRREYRPLIGSGVCSIE